MYSYFPDEIIEEIRVNNDIVDVVSEYVKLDRKGKDFFGLCPFHKEKTPSFSVVPGKQIFYCFGCGKGGNVIHFTMGVENLDYIESVKLLADRARIQLPEGEGNEEKEKAKLKQEIIKINTSAARFFFNNLRSRQGEKADQYLKARRLSDQVSRKFGLGYALQEWDSLHKYLLSEGFSENVALKSGLILPNKTGGYYDRFRDRIMFPIFDIRGNVIGFGGRVMDASMPKYMNSPETPVYEKGRNLYALNFAKNSGEKRIIIVEGYMDVISLHQSGIINTVASLGTALTESQGRTLKKYSEEVIISYDADTAGQAATIRGLDLLNDLGCNVKVLVVPQGKDPDEFVRKNGAEEFKKLIDNSVSLVEYKIKILKKEINTETTDGKVKFLNKIADLLSKVDNRVEREMYIKKLAKDYEISDESILSEVYRRTRPKTNFKKATIGTVGDKIAGVKANGDKDSKLIHYERLFLSLICIDNSIYKLIKDKIGINDFSTEENRQIAGNVFERLENNKGIVPGELLNILNKDTANDFTRIIHEECNCEDNYKAVLDIIKRIEIIKLEKRQIEVLELLKDINSLTERDVDKLRLELKMITKKMSS